MQRLLVLLCLVLSGATAQAAAPREVAITIDDLPVVAGQESESALRDISGKLLAAIAANGIPAVGFVNESRLYRQGELDPGRVGLLRRWLDAGLELGNHGYAHLSLETSSLEACEQDLLRGEAVLRPLLGKRGMKLRYFRYPYLHMSADPAKRRAFQDFLAAHGYVIAPVTVQAADWIFAAAYAKARVGDDPGTAAKVVEAYLGYLDQSLGAAEKLSFDLFGREIRQVLLLHSNSLNADHFGQVTEVLRKRGYRFITLERALEDPAYRSPDLCSAPEGNTWLERQAIGFGLSPDKPPPIPPFVLRLAGPAARGY
jgi:peptidoglycan/xylan/chitin deacetylase (PgdA/CDA1 family)